MGSSGPDVHSSTIVMDGWLVDARCLDADPDMFFPPAGANRSETEAAQRVCLTCPVREPCLDGAVEREEQWGVWGGLSVRDLFLVRTGQASVEQVWGAVVDRLGVAGGQAGNVMDRESSGSGDVAEDETGRADAVRADTAHRRAPPHAVVVGA